MPTDKDLQVLCAHAMGYSVIGERHGVPECSEDGTGRGAFLYNPLSDDGQAFRLVKKFNLMIGESVFPEPGFRFFAEWRQGDRDGRGPDYNRAIVMCVASIQAKKEL